MKKYGLTWGVFSLILMNDLVDTLAQLFMKKGLVPAMSLSLNPHDLFGFFSANASSSTLWVGIIIHTLGFFLWVLTLSRVDLSVAMPLGSTSYILIPIAAMIFLHEHVSLLRWSGILLVIVGMFFIAQSEQAAEKPAVNSLC